MTEERQGLTPYQKGSRGESPHLGPPEIQPIGTRDGLPIIRREDMGALMSIRANQYRGATTYLDFKGYVDMGEPDGVIYRELVQADRILGNSDNQYKGVNIAIWGVKEPGKLISNTRMHSPENRKGYVAQILISDELKTPTQRAKVPSESKYYRDFALSLNPQTDVNAWDKAKQLHDAAVKYVEGGGDLDRLEDFILKLDESLNQSKIEED